MSGPDGATPKEGPSPPSAGPALATRAIAPTRSWWRPPRSVEGRVRYFFFLIAIANALVVVPFVWTAPYSGVRRGLGLLGLAITVWGWFIAYFRRAQPLAGVFVEAIAVFAMLHAMQIPHAALVVVFTGLFFMSLFTTPSIVFTRVGCQAVAFLIAVAFADPGVPGISSPVTIALVPQMALFSAVLFALGRAVQRNDRDRERASALAVFMIENVAAKTHDDLRRAAHAALQTLFSAVGGAGHAIVTLEAGSRPRASASGAFAECRAKILWDALRPVLHVRAGGPARCAELSGADAEPLRKALGLNGGAQAQFWTLATLGSAAHPDAGAVVVLSTEPASRETREALEAMATGLSVVLDLHASHDALRRAEKLATIGQLAATVSHEIRNPLAAIRNANAFLTKRLHANGAPEPRMTQFLGLIDREVEACSRIIGDLLDFARTRAPAREAVAIGSIVEEARTLVTAPEAITNELPEDLPLVRGDHEHLRRVFLNLLQNAIESVPNGRSPRVRVRRMPGPESVVRIAVADNGAGIAPDVRARLFEPLFTTKTRGTGLGLAVVANLVRAHAGKIEVESVDGEGTTFTIELPAETATAPLEEPPVPSDFSMPLP